jgi:hypothetical protein
MAVQSLPGSRPVIALLDDGGDKVREHIRECGLQRWRQTLHLLSQLCIAGGPAVTDCLRMDYGTESSK